MPVIQEYFAFFELFRKGKELANAETWANRKQAANLLGAFLGAALIVAKGFGYDIHVDPETLKDLAAGVAAAVCFGNAVMHAITDKRVGLPAKPGPADGSPDPGWPHLSSD